MSYIEGHALENLSRTVRFKEPEVRLIDEFLKRNAFFDFSSLTRIAVMEFIKQPTVQITPVGTKAAAVSRSKEPVGQPREGR